MWQQCPGWRDRPLQIDRVDMQNVTATTEKLKLMVENYQDFPKKGILFRDMLPILRDPRTFQELIELLVHVVRSKLPHSNIDIVVGLDARGFLLAPLVALKLNAGFVPVRKQGKLPGPTERVEYSLEYGQDIFEVQKTAFSKGQNVIIVDDLIATGGTMNAACQLLQQLDCNVLGCLVALELVELKGKDKLRVPFYSLLQF
jgi:adenine phosphoribosyltransferase